MRTIAAIARDIDTEWKHQPLYAWICLRQMLKLETTNPDLPHVTESYKPNESYMLETTGSLIQHFLAAASTFQGDKAWFLKAELRLLLAKFDYVDSKK